MSNKVGVTGIFVLLIFTIVLTLYQDSRTEKLESEYFNKTNFSFKGIVYNARRYRLDSKYSDEQQPSAGPKFNAYYLRKMYSTIDEYDPSDSTLEFYCIIKQDKIYTVESSRHKNIEGNDIIEYNGKKDITYHYKVISRRENGVNYYDTVLYNKWRPLYIFDGGGNRDNLIKDLLKDVKRLSQ